MIVLTGTLFQRACPVTAASSGRSTELCLANYSTSEHMLIRVRASTEPVRDTDIKHAYVPNILLGRVTKFLPLSHSDMAGFSKAATHAVSQLKWTPHRGESADVITRLLCHSGTIQDSQIFVLFFFSFLLQMY